MKKSHFVWLSAIILSSTGCFNRASQDQYNIGDNIKKELIEQIQSNATDIWQSSYVHNPDISELTRERMNLAISTNTILKAIREAVVNRDVSSIDHVCSLLDDYNQNLIILKETQSEFIPRDLTALDLREGCDLQTIQLIYGELLIHSTILYQSLHFREFIK